MTRSVFSAAATRLGPTLRPAPWWTWTARPGANRSVSRCQLPTSDIGQTSSVALGRAPLSPSSPSATMSASSWAVLPSPMSSALEPHQRGLGLGQLLQLLEAQGAVADGDLVVVVTQAGQPDAAWAGAGQPRRPGPGPQPEAETGRGVPPGRDEDAEAGLLQQGGGVGQEPLGPGGVEFHLRRLGSLERRVEAGPQTDGPAEVGPEMPAGVGHERAEGLEGRPVVPHVAGRHEEAGIVGRLEQDLDPPRYGVRSVVVLGFAVAVVAA